MGMRIAFSLFFSLFVIASSAKTGENNGLPTETSNGAQTVNAGSSSLAAIKERGVLRVGVFAVDTPPFYFMESETGQMNGSDVMLAKAIAKHLGVAMEIKRFGPPFGKMMDAIDNEEADILVSSTTINPERAAKYDTVIYDYTYFSFLIDLPRLEEALGHQVIEPADLNIPEVKILVQKNTPFEAILKNHFPNATQAPVDSNNNVEIMVDAMDTEQAYVAFDRDLVFLIYERTYPESAKQFLLHPLTDITNSVGVVLKKNSDVTPIIQSFIKQRVEVYELSEIIDKYMKF